MPRTNTTGHSRHQHISRIYARAGRRFFWKRAEAASVQAKLTPYIHTTRLRRTKKKNFFQELSCPPYITPETTENPRNYFRFLSLPPQLYRDSAFGKISRARPRRRPRPLVCIILVYRLAPKGLALLLASVLVRSPRAIGGFMGWRGKA